MRAISNRSKGLYLLAALALPMSAGLSAQEQQQEQLAEESTLTVYGSLPADLSEFPKGPEIDGYISARNGDRLQVTSSDGSTTEVTIGEATKVRASGGFLGLEREALETAMLMNGLPVTVKTVEWGGGLAASQVNLKNKDLRTAAMIHTGTNQRFTQHDTQIAENAAATEALRGRVADIDQYNVMGTTNVNFDTGKAALSEQAKAALCAAAAEAEATENALLLVVGYTDATGPEDFNQELSEKRASRVVNYLQQQCGWKPYRMLTPTGMAEADPLADNETAFGKAQNRRVAVNIMVSKAVQGLASSDF